jgi:hypothetical protein
MVGHVHLNSNIFIIFTFNMVNEFQFKGYYIDYIFFENKYIDLVGEMGSLKERKEM